LSQVNSILPVALANVLEWFFLLAAGDLRPAKDRRHHRLSVGEALLAQLPHW